jgi:hypothetical protein
VKKVEPQMVGNYISHLSAVVAVAKPLWKYPLDGRNQHGRDASKVAAALPRPAPRRRVAPVRAGWNIPHVAGVSGHRSWQSLKRYTHIRHTGDKYAGWPWLAVITAGGRP